MDTPGAATLAGCRRMGLVLTWPEAVAVVLEASEQVKREGGTLVTPDLDHISLNPDGTLTILPGSPIPQHPVRQTARLLVELIPEGSAPPDLSAFMAQNIRTPPACAWIEEFTTALAYFERPHRRPIIAEVARRAIASHTPSSGPVPLPVSDVDNRTRPGGPFSRLLRRWFRS